MRLAGARNLAYILNSESGLRSSLLLVAKTLYLVRDDILSFGTANRLRQLHEAESTAPVEQQVVYKALARLTSPDFAAHYPLESRPANVSAVATLTSNVQHAVRTDATGVEVGGSLVDESSSVVVKGASTFATLLAPLQGSMALSTLDNPAFQSEVIRDLLLFDPRHKNFA